MSVPRPPFLPQTFEEFAEHVTAHLEDWFNYCNAAYKYLEHAEGNFQSTESKLGAAELQVAQLKHENAQLKEETSALQHELARDQGVRDYQEEQLQKMQQKLFDALKERDQAIAAATPLVTSPRSSPIPAKEPIAKAPTAATLGTHTPPDSVSASSTRLSERIPDPEKFEGDRRDLRRFVSQVYEKMKGNEDRFPTPQSRMRYVTSRLKGIPYEQILPYIHKGDCTLRDYEEILHILERAFGDPNRARNARNELFKLRQNNKEFSVFFAEFQRLGLEGQMAEDSLSTLLEQSINRELRGMLMHSEPPTREYHQFAKTLQDLENRRRQYETPPTNFRSAYPRNQAPNRLAEPAPGTTQSSPSPALTAPTPQYPIRPTNPDAMDLSAARQPGTSRKERGECFRCGSKNHLIRSCPLPDNRPARLREMHAQEQYSGSPSSSVRTPSPDSVRSPSPDPSAKGVSLA